MPTLAGKVYIVTGGSRGFGLAIAQSLVQQGAKVGLLGRNQSQLDGAVATLGAEHARGVAADVADSNAIDKAFATLAEHFGGLDGLVNNAGLARPASINTMDAADVALQLNTNILGTVNCCKAALPFMANSDNPRIVNISSASAEHHDEMAHLSIYAASKSAVERFSRDLRRELQHEGIGVTILRPGGAATDFAAEWNVERLSAALQAWQHQGTGMDTGMSPEHVGDAVAYCLAMPTGVSVDLLEIRPNTRVEKLVF